MTNNKQQTAMQMAIAHYRKLSEEGSNQAYIIAKFLEENFLEIEMEKIGIAYHEGLIDGMNHAPKNYYEQTYGGDN